jgi:hypothetical protein
MERKTDSMRYSDKDIMQLFAAYSLLIDKVEELEKKLAAKGSKQKCKVIPLVTQKTKPSRT